MKSDTHCRIDTGHKALMPGVTPSLEKNRRTVTEQETSEIGASDNFLRTSDFLWFRKMTRTFQGEIVKLLGPVGDC